MGAYDNLTRDNRLKVDSLIADTEANAGMAPVDMDAFWRDQAVARRNPFGMDIPQCCFGANLTNECVFAELGMEEDYRRFQNDEPWALEVSKRYNDLAEKTVGKRLLTEKPRDPQKRWPPVKQLHDLFEAKNVWEGGGSGSWWLHQSADTPEELSSLLDRVEKRLENLRDFLLPEDWDSEKSRLLAMGEKVPLYRSQRGPCTFACSIFGPENLLLLYYDDEALFRRFSDVLRRAILARARVFDEEAGFTPETTPRGWGWADDNSCLFTPAMYETFAMPIHRAVFGCYSPDAKDRRYQHSDSAMGHLLPLLGELDMTGTNFGPTVSVSDIRRYCPNAVIDGQLAPFTYSRNDTVNIVSEFLRDFDLIRETRGLNFATAGSINNGTRLTSMRLAMAAIQRYGRFE